MQKIEKYIDPVGRTLLAVIFIVSGFGKIGAYAGTQGYMESMGVPGALLPASAVSARSLSAANRPDPAEFRRFAHRRYRTPTVRRVGGGAERTRTLNPTENLTI